MSKTIVYRKATRERLIELLERIGYKVTKQSTDGTFMLVRLPDKTLTGYWIFSDRVEHRLNDFRGGASFYFKDVRFELMDGQTVCISGTQNKSLFLQFHNFKPNPNNLEGKA